MAEDDPGLAARALIYGRTKVCGLTSAADAAAAYAVGATFGGLIFAGESPRRVSLAQARTVRDGADLRWVGVFVDEPIESVVAIARELGLAAVQLHGAEDQAYATALKRGLASGCEIWKAIAVADRAPPEPEGAFDRLLLDASSAPRGARGGTGQAFDWDLLRGYRAKERVVVAGGLSAANVSAAAGLGVWALDFNSGVESAPGKKDAARMAEVFGLLRRLARHERQKGSGS
jgi:indole-3-glycerol phosphate synthase/phosphoribosylanthranilate isomerase